MKSPQLARWPDWLKATIAKNHPRQVPCGKPKVSLAESAGFVPISKPVPATFKECVNNYACADFAEQSEDAYVDAVLAEITAKPKRTKPVTLRFLSSCAVAGKHFPIGTVEKFPPQVAADLLRARRAVVVPFSKAVEQNHRGTGWLSRLLRRGFGLFKGTK